MRNQIGEDHIEPFAAGCDSDGDIAHACDRQRSAHPLTKVKRNEIAENLYIKRAVARLFKAAFSIAV